MNVNVCSLYVVYGTLSVSISTRTPAILNKTKAFGGFVQRLHEMRG